MRPGETVGVLERYGIITILPALVVAEQFGIPLVSSRLRGLNS